MFQERHLGEHVVGPVTFGGTLVIHLNNIIIFIIIFIVILIVIIITVPIITIVIPGVFHPL